jgi:integrase/recombinase XerD
MPSKPKENRSGQALALCQEEVEKIIDLASGPYKIIFAIAAYTGCRISEALTLKAHRVNLRARLITFVETKTGVDRSVQIPAKLLAILEAADLPSEGWLFPSPRTDGHIVRTSADRELRKISADLGLVGVSTHSFRRSLATNLSDLGQPLATIASITGHQSLASLAKYIDITPKQQLAALDLL